MHIQVIGDDESSHAQARTYAEYKVFMALARHTHLVRRARVVLRRGEHESACDRVVCEVTVVLEPSGRTRVRASGSHAYAAINRAVEQIADRMETRNSAAPFIVK